MDDTYAEVGTEVILGAHKTYPWHRIHSSYENTQNNWNPEMREFVGKKAKITAIEHYDSSGCLCCRVDVDHGRWVWRVQNMILASEEVLLR